MLKELRLQNIVLVESAAIPFSSGFNVISGESGAGKSAVMNALNLIAGHRCDISSLRRGAEKGFVEAIFAIENLPEIVKLLDGSGIDHIDGDDLYIRREITAQGKSRTFINNQLAQLSILRDVADRLFHVVGQHANQKLLSLEYHRHVLDLFGDLSPLVNDFAKSWDEENSLRKEVEALTLTEAQRIREIEIYKNQVEEINEAKLQESEEEDVYAHYSRLSNGEQLSCHVQELCHALYGEKHGALLSLSRQKHTLEKLIRLDPSLESLLGSFDQALIELSEIHHTLNQYGSRIEHNPQLVEQLNKRLELINRLKKKYGSTIAQIHQYRDEIQMRLDSLENTDIKIEELQEKIVTLAKKNDAAAQGLTKKRTAAAKKLEAQLTTELQALNMPKVDCAICLTNQKRTRSGDNLIEIFITPNVGERQISLKDCASGGELSRLMLALQTIVAGKESTPTLIFDEIDANIGGTTATIVGEKLHSIGAKHQVISITHFPQVAKHADHHLKIAKQESSGRTITHVEALNSETKKAELVRMSG